MWRNLPILATLLISNVHISAVIDLYNTAKNVGPEGDQIRGSFALQRSLIP